MQVSSNVRHTHACACPLSFDVISPQLNTTSTTSTSTTTDGFTLNLINFYLFRSLFFVLARVNSSFERNKRHRTTDGLCIWFDGEEFFFCLWKSDERGRQSDCFLTQFSFLGHNLSSLSHSYLKIHIKVVYWFTL